MDPEKLVMKGTAQALSLDPDRIHGGTTTREALTSADVGLAMAGMKEAGVAESVIRRVHAALGYMVCGDERARWDLYRQLVDVGENAVRKGRWPERIDGRLYIDGLAVLAIYAHAIPVLDQLLRGEDAPTWCREFAPRYSEIRANMEQWRSIGMAHIRARTEEEDHA